MRIRNESAFPDRDVRAMLQFATRGVDMSNVLVVARNTRRSESFRGRAYAVAPRKYKRLFGVGPENWRLMIVAIQRHEYTEPISTETSHVRWQKITREEFDALPASERWTVRFETLYRHGERVGERLTRQVRTVGGYGGVGSPVMEYANRTEAFIAVAAHEARHVQQFQRGWRKGEVDAEKFSEKALTRWRAEMRGIGYDVAADNPPASTQKGGDPDMGKRKTPDWVTVSQGAESLGIAASTLARQVRDGRVPGATKVGTMWLLPPAGVEHYRENSLGRPGLPVGTRLNRGKKTTA